MPRLERNIYKRKDGRYEARYIKGYNEDGKALYGAVYAHTYAEVKEKRDRVKPPKRKVFVAETKRTVAEEIENYLHSSRNQIKPSTYGIYRRFLENYITPHFNDMRYPRIYLSQHCPTAGTHMSKRSCHGIKITGLPPT